MARSPIAGCPGSGTYATVDKCRQRKGRPPVVLTPSTGCGYFQPPGSQHRLRHRIHDGSDLFLLDFLLLITSGHDLLHIQ